METKPIYNGKPCKKGCNCLEIAEYKEQGGVKEYPCLNHSWHLDALKPLNTMETKQKTLAECKDEVARNTDYNVLNVRFKNWKHFYNHCRVLEMWKFYSEKLNEAAELYAGQTKQSSPVSLEVENLGEKLLEICTHYALEDGSLIMAINPVDAKKFISEFMQSQQPASVALLSEDEINKLCPFVNNGSPRKLFINTAINIQSELRKRVIDPVLYNQWVIDNYSRAIGGLGSGKFFKKYISGTDEDDPVYDEYYTGEELLQIYINSKT